MTDLLVVHDLGDGVGGRPWADAFGARSGGAAGGGTGDAAGDGIGRVVAPDLPGHGDAPPAVGGHHELGDVVFALVEHFAADEAVRPCVVGVGKSGNAARLLALGGRASSLVLVDGLGGPWLDVPARNAALRDLRRQILSTPEALAPPTPGRPDVRAAMVLGQSDREHVVRSLAALPVPTLVVETPSSPTPDAAEVASVIPDHDLVRIETGEPEAVASVVEDWLTTRSTRPAD